MPAAHFDDQIYVNIFHEPLSENHTPKYKALLYVWGSPDNPYTITLFQLPDDFEREFESNSRKDHFKLSFSAELLAPLSVTQNLSIALQHLRRSDTPRIIWIDNEGNTTKTRG
jgi:hypothetical protein